MQPIPANPDLFACVMKLHALCEAELERTQGHHAHALFLALMNRANPDLATTLHESTGSKPFTVATLQGASHRLRPGAGYILRITLLRSELFSPLARLFHAHQQPELRLGNAHFALRELLVTPESHPWAGITSWANLLSEVEPAEEVTIHFVTPTAFSLSSNTAGRKRIGLFPEADAIFGGLLRRWNDLAHNPLPADLLERVEVFPKRYQLRTEMLQFTKSPQLGFIGHCTYQLRGTPADLCLLHALARSAFFLGVGYKTTQGMGLVRVERSPVKEEVLVQESPT